MAFVLQVDIRITPENVDAFMKKLAENAGHARSEPGCRLFHVSVDPSDAAHVQLYEVYDDAGAFAAHQATAHFKKYVAEAVPLLASRERHEWRLVSG